MSVFEEEGAGGGGGRGGGTGMLCCAYAATAIPPNRPCHPTCHPSHPPTDSIGYYIAKFVVKQGPRCHRPITPLPEPPYCACSRVHQQDV
jgi:hypothetical protein